MHNSLGKRDTLNRRRFLSLSGQSLAVMGLAQLIPVNLLAERKSCRIFPKACCAWAGTSSRTTSSATVTT